MRSGAAKMLVSGPRLLLLEGPLPHEPGRGRTKRNLIPPLASCNRITSARIEPIPRLRTRKPSLPTVEKRVTHRVMSDTRFLNTHELASMLGVSAGTVRRWRMLGGGPPYVQLSSQSVRYDRGEVLAWLAERERRPEAARR